MTIPIARNLIEYPYPEHLSLYDAAGWNGWDYFYVGVQSGSAIPPLHSGYLADKICETAANQEHILYKKLQPAWVPHSAFFWFSGVYKAAERSAIRILVKDRAGTLWGSYFSIASGYGIASGTAGASAPLGTYIGDLGGGWYRCGIRVNAAAPGGWDLGIYTYLVDGAGSTSYLGVASSGVHAFGMQVTKTDSLPPYFSSQGWMYGPTYQPDAARDNLHLVEFNFPTPLRFTDRDHAVVWNSAVYSPARLGPPAFKWEMADPIERATFEFQNVDRFIGAGVLGSVVQGERVRVWKAGWSINTFTSTPRLVYEGSVDEVRIREERDTATVQIEVPNAFGRWDLQTPRGSFTATCNWPFKSTTPGCQYTGAASICNKTWERCVELGNFARFKGARHLPAIQDQEIWWGRNPHSS